MFGCFPAEVGTMMLCVVSNQYLKNRIVKNTGIKKMDELKSDLMGASHKCNCSNQSVHDITNASAVKNTK